MHQKDQKWACELPWSAHIGPNKFNISNWWCEKLQTNFLLIYENRLDVSTLGADKWSLNTDILRTENLRIVYEGHGYNIHAKRKSLLDNQKP